MSEDDDETASRRTFIQAGLISVISSGVVLNACSAGERSALPHVSDEQKRFKRKERSKVMLAEAANYENVASVVDDALREMLPQVKGKSIFLKVNLVDYRQGIPICTNPAMVDAVISSLKKAGAGDIKVGDGPALSRDTEELARLSGIGAACKQHGIEFVDLNLDDLDELENPVKLTGLNSILLPRSVTRAELVISLPKLKTHHWALMTCSLKNMFGVVPGRKYGWPKNILHIRGIDKSIIDIVSTVKPGFAIVDAVVAMEGDGPLNGTGQELHLIALGDDLTAVDTVCAMCMELPIAKIPYLQLAGMILGNNELAKIDLQGKSIDSVKKKFVLPPTYEADGSPKDLSKLANGAETGVT